jgi:hypothetical protein
MAVSVRLCKDCGKPGKKGNPLMKEGLHSDWVDCINTLKARCAALDDLARNVAAFDDGLLVSADLNLLRATLREFRDQARKANERT